MRPLLYVQYSGWAFFVVRVILWFVRGQDLLAQPMCSLLLSRDFSVPAEPVLTLVGDAQPVRVSALGFFFLVLVP